MPPAYKLPPIELARQRHGDKYDYTNTTFGNAKTPLTIRCPEHGLFPQIQDAHLRGQGCPTCARIKKCGTSESLLRKAQELHNFRYDYSKAQFGHSENVIEIICPDHGEFKMLQRKHFEGYGCRKCRDAAMRHSTADFLERARSIHGGLYDYSKAEYEGAFVKLTIICREHGEFRQTPDNHVNGEQGCPTCNKPPLGYKLFVERALALHGDKYDYSKVAYEASRKKVEIVCPEKGHGSFWQKPGMHLMGRGCPKCAGKLITHEDWLARVISVHGNRYDYSQAVYAGCDERVIVICRVHGPFSTYAGTHANGTGCVNCADYGWRQYVFGNQVTSGHFYFVRFSGLGEQFLKPGITKNQVNRRFAHLVGRYKVQILRDFPVADLRNAHDIEQSVLSAFTAYKYTPMLEFGGHDECLSSAPGLEAEIQAFVDSHLLASADADRKPK